MFPPMFSRLRLAYHFVGATTLALMVFRIPFLIEPHLKENPGLTIGLRYGFLLLVLTLLLLFSWITRLELSNETKLRSLVNRKPTLKYLLKVYFLAMSLWVTLYVERISNYHGNDFKTTKPICTCLAWFLNLAVFAYIQISSSTIEMGFEEGFSSFTVGMSFSLFEVIASLLKDSILVSVVGIVASFALTTWGDYVKARIKAAKKKLQEENEVNPAEPEPEPETRVYISPPGISDDDPYGIAALLSPDGYYPSPDFQNSLRHI